MTFTDKPVTRKRVAVVSAGVISPLGAGWDKTTEALRAARDCVTPVTRFSVELCRCKTAGQVPDELLDGAAAKRRRRLHRSAQMLITALTELVERDPGFEPELTVIGTTSGGMSNGEDYYRALHRRESLRRSPEWIANYPPQKPVCDALEAMNINTGCQIIANACASGTNAIGHAFACVRSGRYRRVLTGGYDALSELVFVGFDSLQAATPGKCRPFDRERSGMVIGEGAAVLALEEMQSARARGAEIIAEIVGYGLSTDNHHLTQPEPSGIGPRMAMEQALRSAQLESDQIDYINAHGTATPLNDAAEAKAIADLFRPNVPVSSTKGMMGHSLGAAGAIEAVFCLIALQQQFLPANINFRAPDDAAPLNIVANQTRTAPVARALSNSFGFGGTNACIILQRPS